MKFERPQKREDSRSFLSLLRSAESEEHIFAELYERYWSKVYHFAALYLRDEEEIKDAVQEIFLKLWDSQRFLKEFDNIENFLFIITRNHVFNRKRHKSFNNDFFELTLRNASELSYDISTDIDTENMRQLIDKLIEAMPPQRRTVFNLSRKECLTNRQIALQLSISEKTVEKHIQLSLKYLRNNLLIFFIFWSL